MSGETLCIIISALNRTPAGSLKSNLTNSAQMKLNYIKNLHIAVHLIETLTLMNSFYHLFISVNQKTWSKTHSTHSVLTKILKLFLTQKFTVISHLHQDIKNIKQAFLPSFVVVLNVFGYS